MARLFTSDQHLGHPLVAAKRGFASAEEHDETLIRNWNEEVKPEDRVYVLGDAAMGNRSVTLKLYHRMNGHKILISGNHDDCWPGHQNTLARSAAYREVFGWIQPFMRVNIAGHPVLLSHFPYQEDHTESPRFMQYRLPNLGGWLLHGHTHSTVRQTSAREIHVGLDAWQLRPVAESRIRSIINQQLHQERRNGSAAARKEDVPPVEVSDITPSPVGDAPGAPGAPGNPGRGAAGTAPARQS